MTLEDKIDDFLWTVYCDGIYDDTARHYAFNVAQGFIDNCYDTVAENPERTWDMDHLYSGIAFHLDAWSEDDKAKKSALLTLRDELEVIIQEHKAAA